MYIDGHYSNWVDSATQFREDFLQTIKKITIKIFLEVDVQ